MNGETFIRKIVITNPQGFHLRPMAAFAERAGRYQSNVTVCKDEKKVNGKSPLELMLLAAEQGTELIVEASGPDACQALESLFELMTNLAFEDDSPNVPLPPKG